MKQVKLEVLNIRLKLNKHDFKHSSSAAFDFNSPEYAGNKTVCVRKHWNPISGDQNECKWQHLYSRKSILLLSSSVSKLINMWATI